MNKLKEVIQTEGYGISQMRRKKEEEPFGWMKKIGQMDKLSLRGIRNAEWLFTMSACAYNMIRISNGIPYKWGEIPRNGQKEGVISHKQSPYKRNIVHNNSMESTWRQVKSASGNGGIRIRRFYPIYRQGVAKNIVFPVYFRATKIRK